MLEKTEKTESAEFPEMVDDCNAARRIHTSKLATESPYD